jgi:RNA polymerase sigma-B factor
MPVNDQVTATRDRAHAARPSSGSRNAATSSMSRLSDEDTARLLADYRRTGDISLRNRVVEAHTWLAVVCARRLVRRDEPLDDLAQVASIGILKAADRFDPSFGVLFRTYASATALGELRRHYRDSWRIRVSRGTQELHLQVVAAIDHLTSQRRTSPTLQDVAEYLGRSFDDVLDAYVAGTNHRPAPLHPTGEDSSGEAHEMAALGQVDVAFDHALDRAEVGRLVAGLPERDREIVILRFVCELTQSEIAERVGISQVHVSRLLRRAIQQMRRASADGDEHAVFS